MRFQIKKLLEGYDPADLIEQSMYCFGSDSDGDGSILDDTANIGKKHIGGLFRGGGAFKDR